VAVVGIGPQSHAQIMVDPVVGHLRPVDIPEFDASGATASDDAILPIIGIVVGDFVVVDDDVGYAGGLECTQAILAIIFNTIVSNDVSAADEYAGAVVVGDGVVLDGPVMPAIVVDHAFVVVARAGAKVSNGQVSNRHADRVLRKGVVVFVLT